jgi:hypothetical protein
MSGVVARKPPGGSTLADLLAIPEEERSRYELLDGEVVEREAATGEHGGTQSDLVAFLHARFSRRPGGRWPGGWWFATEVDISFDEVNTLRPDVLGWRRDRHPHRPGGYPVTVLPHWTCEVLSSNKRNDLIKRSASISNIGSPTTGSSILPRERCSSIVGPKKATQKSLRRSVARSCVPSRSMPSTFLSTCSSARTTTSNEGLPYAASELAMGRRARARTSSMVST